MNLPEYIERHGGDDECARRWGVKSRTVASWRRRERVPRPAQAARIIEAEDGAISVDGIYGPAVRAATTTPGYIAHGSQDEPADGEAA